MNPEDRLTCEEVLADLPLFVGGDLLEDDLQASAAASLRRHLDKCDPCHEAFASLQRARQAFLTLGEGTHAPGLWPDVRAVLAAEGRLGGVAAPAPVLPFRRAVAAVLVAGLGVFAWFAIQEGPDDPTGSGELTVVVVDEAPAPESSSLLSPLRPLHSDELALSLEAEVFGEGGAADVATPSHTPGAVSAAGMTKIR